MSTRLCYELITGDTCCKRYYSLSLSSSPFFTNNNFLLYIHLYQKNHIYSRYVTTSNYQITIIKITEKYIHIKIYTLKMFTFILMSYNYVVQLFASFNFEINCRFFCEDTAFSSLFFFFSFNRLSNTFYPLCMDAPYNFRYTFS